MPRKRGPSVRLDTAIESFLSAHDPEKIDAKTITSRKRTLRFLVKAAGGPHRMTRNLTYQHFQACIDDLSRGAQEGENMARRLQGKAPRSGRGASSLGIDRTNLKKFVEWMKYNNWVEANFYPLYRVAVSSKQQPGVSQERMYRRRHVPHEQWPDLLDTADNPRDRMVIAIGLYWGARASTISKIKIKHLNLQKGLLELTNVKKGRPYELNAIGPDMRHEIDRYLAWYTAYYGKPEPDWYLVPAKLPGYENCGRIRMPDDWPLVPTRPLLPRLVVRIARKALRGIGWTEEMCVREGSHTLRRSAAVWIEDQGGTTAATALLDHETPETTMTYTGNRAGKKALAKIMSSPATLPDPEPEAVTPESELPLAEVIDLSSRRRVG